MAIIFKVINTITKEQINVPRQNSKKCSMTLCESIEDYLADHPHADKQDVQDLFFESLPYWNTRIFYAKRIIIAFLCCLVLSILCFALANKFLPRDTSYDSVPTYYEK